MQNFQSREHLQKYAVDQSQCLLESAINATPTSEAREKLTEVNIMLLQVIEDYKLR